jgi:hypothetical protein
MSLYSSGHVLIQLGEKYLYSSAPCTARYSSVPCTDTARHQVQLVTARRHGSVRRHVGTAFVAGAQLRDLPLRHRNGTAVAVPSYQAFVETDMDTAPSRHCVWRRSSAPRTLCGVGARDVSTTARYGASLRRDSSARRHSVTPNELPRQHTQRAT